MTLTLEVDLPADLARLRLPGAVAARLQSLLDRQGPGQPLNAQEREEAEGLVNLAEFLTLRHAPCPLVGQQAPSHPGGPCSE